MEANKSKYSCVSASCGKPLFSEVKFCPYCAEPYVSEESKLKALQEAKAKEEQELVKQQALAKENAKAQAAAKALADQEAKQAAEALAKAEEKAKKDQEKAQAEANKQAEAKAKQEAQEAQRAEQEKAKQQEQVTQAKSDTANKSGSEAATTTKAPRTYEVKPEDKKGGFGKWLLILIVVGVAGFYGAKQWSVLGGGANMCEQTITDVTGMLATGDANGALIKIKEVLPDCSGDSKTRLVDIQKAANKALKAQTATCNAALSKVNQAINKNQIISARKAFDKLPANCESFNQAKNLKDTLSQKEDLIKTAESDFDAAIADGNLDKAKIALNKLQELTREHLNLAKMKKQLDEAVRKSEASTTSPDSMPTPTPAPVQNTVSNNNRQNQAAPVPVNAQNLPQITNNVRDWVDANRRAANNQAQAPAPVKLPNNVADIEQAANNRMSQTFMQEAQNALQQKRFDVARTQVQNALRVDPGNKEAQLLMRRINEVQMQTLRNQTTID